MRGVCTLILVVTVFSNVFAVTPGLVYETNILVERNEASPWAGVYGFIGHTTQRFQASYFETPFGFVYLGPNEVNTSIDTNRIMAVYNFLHWYAGFSERNDVNFYALQSTCGMDINPYFDGNFPPDLLPSNTYTLEENIYVNGTQFCAKKAVLNTGIPTYMLLYSSSPVFLTPLDVYLLPAHYAFLVSTGTKKIFWIYLVRKNILCGDYVCDPGETNCPDCSAVSITITPDSREVNAGTSTSFIVKVTNTGFSQVTVTLTPVRVTGTENEISLSLDTNEVTLDVGAEETLILTAVPKTVGVFRIRVDGAVGSSVFQSNEVTVISKGTEEEEEEQPSGGGGAPPEEENKEIIPLEEGGYYIPWAKCISFINVFGPDRVLSKLYEEKNITLLVQNAGTCDENIEMSVDTEFPYKLSSNTFSLKKGEGKKIVLTIKPNKPGIHTVTIFAKGYSAGKHTLQLSVSQEVAEEEANCVHNLLILSPDEIEVEEGKEVNNIVISNLGTCREKVVITVVKKAGGAEILLDRRELYLTGGEKFVYNLPRLASGEYEVTISAGGQEKISKLTVTPKPLFGAFGETLARARVAALFILVLILIAVLGYIRYKYLR